MSPRARAFLQTQGVSTEPPAPKAIPACLTKAETPRRVPRKRPVARKAPPDFYKLGNASSFELAKQLRRMRNRKAVAAIRVAAFSGARGWQSAVAIGVIRHALAIMMLTDQRGVVRDVPMTLFRHAHRNRRTNKKPCPDTIGGGVHRPDGNLDNGQAGYGRLLELGGFMTRRQYRKRSPSRPDIKPSCNFYTVCEPEIELTAGTPEQCDETVAIRELANIPHPSSGIPPHPPRPPP